MLLPGSLRWAGSSFSPAWLLMNSASKWPLPVTHSAFCAPEAVVLGFTLESNHTAFAAFSAAGIRASYSHCATKKCARRPPVLLLL